MSDAFFAERTTDELRQYCADLQRALRWHEDEHPDCPELRRGWDIYQRVRCEVHLRTSQ